MREIDPRRGIVGALYRTAAARAAGVFVSSIVGGALTNWWIADLSEEGTVAFDRIGDTWASLALAVFCLIFLLYTYGQYRFETDLLRWNDRDYVTARARRDLYPALIEKAVRDLPYGRGRAMGNLLDDMFGHD